MLRDHEPLLLGKALRKLLDRVGAQQKQEIVIKVDPVSIADHMVRIVDRLKVKSGGCLFEDLFDKGDLNGLEQQGGKNIASPKLSVSSIVATFLALLS